MDEIVYVQTHKAAVAFAGVRRMPRGMGGRLSVRRRRNRDFIAGSGLRLTIEGKTWRKWVEVTRVRN